MLQTEIPTKSDAVEEMLQYLELDFTHGDTVLEYREQPECQGLSVEKTAGCVHIVYSEPVYLYRALGLVKEQGERKCYSIRETARFTMNGPMLDCSRGAVLSVPALREMLRQLALMGHNTVMLYTEDTYEIDGEPYFGYMRGRYTVEELRELDDYADRFGIRLVPCIQTLGHLAAALRWGPYKAFSDTGDILLVDDERTYVLIELMLKTCRKAYRSDRIHVGLDETHFMGRGKYYDLHGDSDKTELFLAASPARDGAVREIRVPPYDLGRYAVSYRRLYRLYRQRYVHRPKSSGRRCSRYGRFYLLGLLLSHLRTLCRVHPGAPEAV